MILTFMGLHLAIGRDTKLLETEKNRESEQTCHTNHHSKVIPAGIVPITHDCIKFMIK